MAAADAPRVRVLERTDDVAALVRYLGIGAPRPVVVLIGGAGGLSDAQVGGLTEHLRTYVLPAIHRVGAVVVDGGTDSGVMRAIGRTRRDAATPFPLVGVVVRGVLTSRAPAARADEAVALEPHHTDLVVVPGETWGDEVPWIGRVASAIAGPRSSVTLLVNGGEIAYRDMAESLRRDRPVVVLAGSGRTADAVAAAADGTGAASTEAHRLAGSPLTVIVRYDDGPRLRDVLDTLLGPAIITE